MSEALAAHEGDAHWIQDLFKQLGTKTATEILREAFTNPTLVQQDNVTSTIRSALDSLAYAGRLSDGDVLWLCENLVRVAGDPRLITEFIGKLSNERIKTKFAEVLFEKVASVGTSSDSGAFLAAAGLHVLSKTSKNTQISLLKRLSERGDFQQIIAAALKSEYAWGIEQKTTKFANLAGLLQTIGAAGDAKLQTKFFFAVIDEMRRAGRAEDASINQALIALFEKNYGLISNHEKQPQFRERMGFFVDKVLAFSANDSSDYAVKLSSRQLAACIKYSIRYSEGDDGSDAYKSWILSAWLDRNQKDVGKLQELVRYLGGESAGKYIGRAFSSGVSIPSIIPGASKAVNNLIASGSLSTRELDGLVKALYSAYYNPDDGVDLSVLENLFLGFEEKAAEKCVNATMALRNDSDFYWRAWATRILARTSPGFLGQLLNRVGGESLGEVTRGALEFIFNFPPIGRFLTGDVARALEKLALSPNTSKTDLAKVFLSSAESAQHYIFAGGSYGIHQALIKLLCKCPYEVFSLGKIEEVESEIRHSFVNALKSERGLEEDLRRSLIKSVEGLMNEAQKLGLPEKPGYIRTEALGYIHSAGYLIGIAYDAAEITRERTKEGVENILDVLFDLGLARLKFIRSHDVLDESGKIVLNPLLDKLKEYFAENIENFLNKELREDQQKLLLCVAGMAVLLNGEVREAFVNAFCSVIGDQYEIREAINSFVKSLERMMEVDQGRRS